MIFESSKEYISVYEIKNVISGILKKKSFNDVKELIEDIHVKYSEEEIKKYLDDRLRKEKPDLLKRVKKRKNDNSKKSFDKMIEEFADELEMSTYSFDSFTLDYFKNYINILKKKISKMISILDQIEDKNNKEIFPLLEDIDITIDDKRNIKNEDAERILKAILYNLSNLLKKSDEANKLETYYSFKLSKDSIYQDGFIENDLYPSEKIQEKNLLVGFDCQYISLTDKQVDKIREDERKMNKYILSIVSQMQK